MLNEQVNGSGKTLFTINFQLLIISLALFTINFQLLIVLTLFTISF